MFTAIKTFSRGQSQPQPQPPQPQPQLPTHAQAQKVISDQVRQEWHDFESAWFKPQQSGMERRCAEKFKEMDKVFRASTAANTPPVASSSSKSKKRSTNNNTNTTNNSAAAKAAAKEHESKKMGVREELRKELVLKAREEWQRRLTGKGLRDDDWADMSVDEQEAVERALGGDFEEDDEDDSEQEMTFSQMQAPMMSTAAVGTSLFPSLSSLPSQPAASSLAAVAGPSSNSRTTLPSLQTLQTNVAPAPSLSSATRSTNASTASSSYAFVNPSSLGKPARPTQPEDDDDDDETSPFEDIGFVYDAMKRKSDYRDAYDTPTGSSSFSGTNSGWSTDLSLSTHTSHTSSPEQPAPRTIPPMDKDSSMPGSWFASAGPSQKDVNATPTTATAKGTKSGWGAASAGPSKLNGKAGAPAHPSTSTTTTTNPTTSSSSSASTRTRSSGHYVGPDLNTTDDFPFTSSSSSASASASTSHNTDNSTLLTSNSTFSSQSQSSSSSEEADFENYKMDVRIAKIREFHEEAAAADENLIREIFRARKLWKLGLYDEEIDMGSDEGRDIERGSMEYTDILRKRREKKCWEVECRRIEEHERTMVNLRKLKEDERRGIVEMERRKRREAIRGQQQQQQQQRGSVVGQQQQRREREAREREAKEEAAREREREIMMKETEMRERAIALMGSKPTSSHGSLFAPPTQISLEHSASSFASAFNNTSMSTSLFTPTPATSTTNPFNVSFHQPSQSSSHPTNTTTKPTISLFPEEEEFAIDEAKIASMLASQMQMAQKFDGWSSGSGGGSKGGSPRSLGEGGTPLPATTTSSGNETKGSGSSTLGAKVEPSSTTKAAPSVDNSTKGESEKLKEEKGQVKKGPSTSAPAATAAGKAAPAIAVTSSSESEPKSETVKVVPATGKNAKKKGKKGQTAVPVPAPAPAPTPVKEKEVAKAPAKAEATKTPAKVETTTTAKGKTASPPVKEVPTPAKSGKVETKTPVKKDDTPISTTSSSSTSNATSSGPAAKVSSIWGKKEEPAVAKAKKEETTSTPPTSISQSTKTAPTPTRWKVSLFDDEPTPAPVPVSSKSTMDSMTSSSTSSSFAAKHGLQPPSAQSFWHPPGTNSGVARSTSDQPGGGLKAPEPSSVARAASDQPVNKMTSSSSSMAAQKSVPERWLPPQAKQQQQPQASAAQPQPQPWDRTPTNPSFARTRRMSEPAPPSPVDPAFFAEASKANNGRSAEVQGILKNTPATKASASGRGKAGRKATVVVEDASDDEEDQDGIVGEALAVDSRYIMEENPGIVRPKPSVAGKMFNNIFDYEEDDSGSSTTEVPVSFAAGGEGLMKGAGEGGMSWDTLAKSGKAKHVRWTPSTLGNASPISFGGDEETASVNIENFLQTATSTLASAGMPTQAPPQGRGRTSSVSHASGGFKGWGQTVPASAFGGGGAVAERGDMDVMGLGKGKGVDRGSFSKQDASDEMGWYTKGAMESLKQMRSKPASAV